MRIKYKAIPRVVNVKPAAPLAGPAVAELPKQETAKKVELSKKDKKKTERALDWPRRNR
jgi:hypothetical protein